MFERFKGDSVEKKPSIEKSSSFFKKPSDYKTKEVLLQGTEPVEAIDRIAFRLDVYQTMRAQKSDLVPALREFFVQNPGMTPKERGFFASELADGGLAIGAVYLARALQHDPSFHPEDLFTKYFPVDQYDYGTQGLTWKVDAMMGWLPGTSCPQSLPAWEKFMSNIEAKR